MDIGIGGLVGGAIVALAAVVTLISACEEVDTGCTGVQVRMDCYADKNWLDKIEKVEGYEFRRMIELLHEGDKNGH